MVSGADALVVTSRTRAPTGARVRALRALHNPDGQEGDGLRTGLAEIAHELWHDAALDPAEVDLACVYDDYPAMVLVQLADLGLLPDGDPARFLRERVERDRWPLNTSGGQLSAGQAGAAGGMHGLVEAVTQLPGKAGERQLERARIAVVTGYGMVLYRYGACAAAAVIEGAAPRDAEFPFRSATPAATRSFRSERSVPRCGSRDWHLVTTSSGVVDQVTTHRRGGVVASVATDLGPIVIARSPDGSPPGTRVALELEGGAPVARRGEPFSA